MKTIGIIGYGQLGKQFEHLIKTVEQNIKFKYFDDNALENNIENSFPFNHYLEDKYKNIEFIVGLGYKHLATKREIINNLMTQKRKILSFIHPTAIIDKSAKIGFGTFIYPNVTIDKNVVIGAGCLINLSCTIAHDSSIDDCSFLAPSVTISGFVSIGKEVFLGTGVCVANDVLINDSVIVGIGSVITKDINPNQHVIGNPQKTVRNLKIQ